MKKYEKILSLIIVGASIVGALQLEQHLGYKFAEILNTETID
jgi:hypothetical protein